MCLVSLGLLVLAVCALGACRLPRQSQTPRYWMLTPIESTQPASEIERSVGVGPVEFPEYLDRFGVVRRTGANQIHVAFPWKGPDQNLAYRLVVEVDRFDAGPDDRVALDAGWALHRGASAGWVAGGRTAIREPVQGQGYPAIVAAMSQAVGALSREIAPHLGGAR
jgi:uncharacterized lipoprotein YmbA